MSASPRFRIVEVERREWPFRLRLPFRPRRPFRDLYAFLLHTSWPVVFGLAALSYLIVNATFGLLYWLAPGCIANSSGSYLEAFFFSVRRRRRSVMAR